MDNAQVTVWMMLMFTMGDACGNPYFHAQRMTEIDER